MLKELEYLETGLLDATGLRNTLLIDGRLLADRFYEQGVDPTQIEWLSGLLARFASYLPEAHVFAKGQLLACTHGMDLAQPLQEFLTAAISASVTRKQVVALALHLADIAESLAFRGLLAEVPALLTNAKMSGTAARSTGSARRLRG